MTYFLSVHVWTVIGSRHDVNKLIFWVTPRHRQQ